MEVDSRSRKWLLTINNPKDKGYTHSRIKELLSDMKSVMYWVMADEVGEEGTYHTHVYVYSPNAIRFSTLKNRFEGAHFDMANGTSQQNRDYIYKEGKWEKDKKKETHLPETREEFGEMPVERQGKRNDLDDLYDMIKSGMTNFEIIEQCPQYMLNIDKIERVRQILLEEKYKNNWRDLEVTYIFGETETGKTRSVMEKYGYENVYRVTDYKNPFDGYKGQDVVMFEEFRSSLKIQDMLNYLDGYPVYLPCRYNNKVACYTKAFIVTNIPLEKQYQEIQNDYPETYSAFIRRITTIMEYDQDNVFVFTDYFDYLTRNKVLSIAEKQEKLRQIELDRQESFEFLVETLH